MSLGTHRIDLPCEGDEQALIWGHTVEVSRLSRRGKVFAPAVSIKYGHCKFLNLGVHLSSRTKCNITKDLWVRGDAMIHHEEMTSCTHQAPASRGRHTLFLSVILCYPSDQIQMLSGSPGPSAKRPRVRRVSVLFPQSPVGSGSSAQLMETNQSREDYKRSSMATIRAFVDDLSRETVSGLASTTNTST